MPAGKMSVEKNMQKNISSQNDYRLTNIEKMTVDKIPPEHNEIKKQQIQVKCQNKMSIPLLSGLINVSLMFPLPLLLSDISCDETIDSQWGEHES